MERRSRLRSYVSFWMIFWFVLQKLSSCVVNTTRVRELQGLKLDRSLVFARRLPPGTTAPLPSGSAGFLERSDRLITEVEKG